MEALRVEHLSKDFGGIHACRDVSFRIESGERLAIIGPNGAGKTTLFNLLGGQLSPSAGQILFFRKNITNMAEHRRAHLGIARSFQINTLFSNLAVVENVLLAIQGIRTSRFQIFRTAGSYKQLYARADELLSSIGLYEKRNEPVHSISYGDKRKLEITLSLALEPKILLLDEATTGLTNDESNEVIDHIRSMGKNITLIFIAHDMDLVFGIAERIIVLHYGEILAEGTCGQIKENAKVNEIYMGIEGIENKCSS